MLKLVRGFTLIEIVLSMFVILAIVTILFTTSATFKTSRRSNLNTLAGKIAARQVESLRKTDYSSLPAVGSSSFTDSELTRLPEGTANQTVSLYQSNADVKQFAITVGWSEGGMAKSVTMDTLIYRNGI